MDEMKVARNLGIVGLILAAISALLCPPLSVFFATIALVAGGFAYTKGVYGLGVTVMVLSVLVLIFALVVYALMLFVLLEGGGGAGIPHHFPSAKA